MTPTLIFVLFAALLVLVAAAFLLPPLWRQPRGEAPGAGRRAANLRIFRDQLAELERERADGALAEGDFDQAQRELRHRLLAEVEATPEALPAPGPGPSRGAALALILFLPLAAGLGYRMLGAPEALDPLATAAPGQVTAQQIETMIGALAERLKAHPDDLQGWLMLGRSYAMTGRLAEAVAAYGKAEKAMEGDADLLAGYADLLASQNGGRLDGKPLALIGKALRVDPDHVQALWLAGTAAFNNGAYADAVVFWERAVKVLPADSEDAASLGAGIAEAKRRGAAGGDPARTIAGQLQLAPALKERFAATDTVFIIARPVDGSRTPLAVLRAQVADLPYAFVLDDRSSMAENLRLSQQQVVEIEARISRGRDVRAKPGDGRTAPVKVRVGARHLNLVIDQVIEGPALPDQAVASPAPGSRSMASP